MKLYQKSHHLLVGRANWLYAITDYKRKIVINKSDKINDRLLLEKAIKEACPKSLAKIYLKYKPFVVNYIAKRVGFRDEWQDLVHTVFLRLCQGKCQYTGNSDVQAYICGIAKNVLRDYYKTQKARIKIVDVDGVEVTGDLLMLNNQIDAPLEGLEKEELLEELQLAVSGLPLKSRDAIELFYKYNCDLLKASKKAKCSQGALQRRLNYAISLLKQKIKKT